jgi:thiol-disulfide isomerase/thioredoxin
MKRILMLFAATALIFAQGAPKRAPGFCLIDTAGQWRDLADYRGKVVIVEFMQTTCPHCAAFAPKLQAVQQKYAGKLQVIAVAIAPQDNPNTMMEYVKGHNPNYPLLFDMGQVAMSYVRGPNLHFPTLYLIDSDGMMRGTWEDGPLAKDIFEGNGLSKEIDKLLGSPAAAAKKK